MSQEEGPVCDSEAHWKELPDALRGSGVRRIQHGSAACCCRWLQWHVYSDLEAQASVAGQRGLEWQTVKSCGRQFKWQLRLGLLHTHGCRHQSVVEG